MSPHPPHILPLQPAPLPLEMCSAESRSGGYPLGDMSAFGAAFQPSVGLLACEEGSLERECVSDLDKPMYRTDKFRMYCFKVLKCLKTHPHDWTECPFVHPGEKARRRDPCKFKYSGTACPDFRKGSCKRGDACPFAHGVFECWLHTTRYRTTMCRDGPLCTRRVCFFAHAVTELRQPALPASRADENDKENLDPLTGVNDFQPAVELSRRPHGPGFQYDTLTADNADLEELNAALARLTLGPRAGGAGRHRNDSAMTFVDPPAITCASSVSYSQHTTPPRVYYHSATSTFGAPIPDASRVQERSGFACWPEVDAKTVVGREGCGSGPSAGGTIRPVPAPPAPDHRSHLAAAGTLTGKTGILFGSVCSFAQDGPCSWVSAVPGAQGRQATVDRHLPGGTYDCSQHVQIHMDNGDA